VRPRFVRLALLALLALPAPAGEGLKLSPDEPVLFVTHAYEGGSQWPAGYRAPAGQELHETMHFAKPAIDAAVAAFEKRGWPVIYLGPGKGLPPIMEDRSPTAELKSEDGRHELEIPTRHVFVAGGMLAGCAWNTVASSISSAEAHQRALFPGKRPEVTIHLWLDAVFGAKVWSPTGERRLRTRKEKIELFAKRLRHDDWTLELYHRGRRIHAVPGPPGGPLVRVRFERGVPSSMPAS